MEYSEFGIGRRFVLRVDPGEELLESLQQLCAKESIQSAYVPMFIAAFNAVELVGTCDPVEDPAAPIWSSVALKSVEAHGGGTIAWRASDGAAAAHIHLSGGLKTEGAKGLTSHLLRGVIQFLAEVVLVEIAPPGWQRWNDPAMYGVGRLITGPDSNHWVSVGPG